MNSPAPTTPTLGAPTGNTVVRIHSLSAPARRAHTRLLVRQDGLPIGALSAPLDAPFILTIPQGPGITLDVWGTDAIDLPVSVGQVVRIVVP